MSQAQKYQYKRCYASHQQSSDRLFNVWGIDYMGPFVKSWNYEYILVALYPIG